MSPERFAELVVFDTVLSQSEPLLEHVALAVAIQFPDRTAGEAVAASHQAMERVRRDYATVNAALRAMNGPERKDEVASAADRVAAELLGLIN